MLIRPKKLVNLRKFAEVCHVIFFVRMGGILSRYSVLPGKLTWTPNKMMIWKLDFLLTMPCFVKNIVTFMLEVSPKQFLISSGIIRPTLLHHQSIMQGKCVGNCLQPDGALVQVAIFF